MFNTSVCLTENTQSPLQTHTGQRRCEQTCSGEEEFASTASYYGNPANTTELTYDISLK